MPFIGVPGLIFIVLLILKIVGVIACSWWIVTLPLWLPVAIFLIVIVIFLSFFGSIAGIVSGLSTIK